MAVRLGRVNVDAMLRGLTFKQFLEWEQYSLLEPFDEMRADWRTASIVQMIHNMAVASEHRKEVGEFLLKFVLKEEEKPPDPDQTWKNNQMWGRIIAMAVNAGSIEAK